MRDSKCQHSCLEHSLEPKEGTQGNVRHRQLVKRGFGEFSEIIVMGTLGKYNKI